MNPWLQEQRIRSAFFHEKLHEWRLLEIYDVLNSKSAAASQWTWDLQFLGIHKNAWNLVIHNGIKPILVFAHPKALQEVVGAVRYYRHLAMLSQKSMSRVGMSVISFEEGRRFPNHEEANELARLFNAMISDLILADQYVREEELWLWRGMGAGDQASGSWRNHKGRYIATLVFEWLKETLLRQGWTEEAPYRLRKGSFVVESLSEPDIQVRDESRDEIVAAVEIKGGLDPAGVLERIGATVKTLQRIKSSSPSATTILVLQKSSMTDAAFEELERHKQVINKYFFLEELILPSVQSLTEKQKDFLYTMRLM